MMKAYSVAVMAIVALAASAPARADVPLLRDALERKYPEVESWSIDPLRGDSDAQLVRVIKLGARSAVLDDQGTVRWYAVAGYQPVYVATSAMARGEPFDVQQFAIEARSVLGRACQPITSRDHLIGARAAHPLRPGDVLCNGATEAIPEVIRGAPVQVRSAVGGVTVFSKAQALNDAELGELVRVRNVKTRISFVTEVVGMNEVRVYEN